MFKIKIEYLPSYDKEWEKLSYKHPGDSGFDLRAAIEEPVTLQPGQFKLISCGLNSPGTVDFFYRGEIKTPLINLSNQPFTINPGERIAQAVICPVIRAQIEETTSIDEDTARGSGGFGSTGKI